MGVIEHFIFCFVYVLYISCMYINIFNIYSYIHLCLFLFLNSVFTSFSQVFHYFSQVFHYFLQVFSFIIFFIF